MRKKLTIAALLAGTVVLALVAFLAAMVWDEERMRVAEAEGGE